MSHRLVLAFVLCFLPAMACQIDHEVDSAALLAPAGKYENIYYHNCIGYDGDDTHASPNPSACTAEADCAAVCPAGKKCGCDKSCGCCVVQDWDGPKPDATYYRYSWTACPDTGTCPAEYTRDNEYTWFSQLPNLTEPDELIDELCMQHIEVGNTGCVYRAEATGKNCSLPSTGGAGKYECGNETCAGNEIYQCAPGPTGKFTYKLVGDHCKAPVPQACDAAMPGTDCVTAI